MKRLLGSIRAALAKSAVTISFDGSTLTLRKAPSVATVVLRDYEGSLDRASDVASELTALGFKANPSGEAHSVVCPFSADEVKALEILMPKSLARCRSGVAVINLELTERLLSFKRAFIDSPCLLRSLILHKDRPELRGQPIITNRALYNELVARVPMRYLGEARLHPPAMPLTSATIQSMLREHRPGGAELSVTGPLASLSRQRYGVAAAAAPGPEVDLAPMPDMSSAVMADAGSLGLGDIEGMTDDDIDLALQDMLGGPLTEKDMEGLETAEASDVMGWERPAAGGPFNIFSMDGLPDSQLLTTEGLTDGSDWKTDVTMSAS